MGTGATLGRTAHPPSPSGHTVGSYGGAHPSLLLAPWVRWMGWDGALVLEPSRQGPGLSGSQALQDSCTHSALWGFPLCGAFSKCSAGTHPILGFWPLRYNCQVWRPMMKPGHDLWPMLEGLFAYIVSYTNCNSKSQLKYRHLSLSVILETESKAFTLRYIFHPFLIFYFEPRSC